METVSNESEVMKMADEKMMMPHTGKALKVLGILAIVYGVINYLQSQMDWPQYQAWIAGGVILLLVSWAKGGMRE